MKALLVISLILISFQYSYGSRGITIPYSLDKSSKDSLLGKDEAIFTFTFKGLIEGEASENVHYSIDSIEQTVQFSSDQSIMIKTTPGIHNFQFFISRRYVEVYVSQIEIKSQNHDEYSIYLRDSSIPVISAKPVIYLYPEQEIDVEVKISIRGQKPFFYPAYDDGWRIKACPDGTISYEGATYKYLFWEATNFNQLSVSDMKSGFVIKSEETVLFLEEKLTLAGLNSKERADFITFWGPRLIQNKANFIRFEFNEACNKFAELKVTPKPTTIYRIYILWSPIDTDYKVEEQEIIPMTRKGFTVIEWGGQEHEIGEIIEKNNEL